MKFDGVALESICVDKSEIENAESLVSFELREAILSAKNNIEKFHRAQYEETINVETTPGVICSRKSVPIEKVGFYVPGGSAPLFSTLLMLGVPARIAGCREIVVCSPPQKDGKVSPIILFVAHLLGISSVYKIGGAQAIAAMAYGTETVPAVYKIFGPGNQYVTAAKLLLSKQYVAIDLPAGPSEVLVFADSNANPDFVASDLLAQAEHGPDSQVLFVTNDKEYSHCVLKALEAQLNVLPRKNIAERSLANSSIVVFESKDEAMDFVNFYAPEHLILATNDADDLADKVVNAGSVFVGQYSTESLGDYASGTNHTLPTMGVSRAFSGVSLDSFVKKITFQKVSEQGLLNIGPCVCKMAEAEGLDGHKQAVSIRLKSLL